MNKCSICAYDACVDNDNIWYMHLGHNALYKCDIKEKCITYMGSVPGEKNEQLFLYTGIVKYHNKIVLIPCHADSLAIYDVYKKKFEVINIEIDNITAYYDKFTGYKVVNDTIWMIGGRIPYLVGINLITYSQRILRFTEELINGIYSLGNSCVSNNSLFIPLYYKSAVAIVDLNTLIVHEKTIDCEFEGFSSVNFFNDRFIFTSKNSSQILWCKDTLKKEKTMILDSCIKCERPFRKTLVLQDELWIIPDQCTSLFIVDKKACMKQIQLSKTEVIRHNGITDALITMAIIINDKILLDNNQDKCMIVCSSEEKKYIQKEEFKMDTPFEDVYFWIENVNGCLYESDFIGLSQFIQEIK